MSSEVVVPVDRVGRLLAVLADDHGSEVAGEELIVGPQVESEMPVDTRRRCSDFTNQRNSTELHGRTPPSYLCRALKLISFSTCVWVWTSRRRTECVCRLERGSTSKSSSIALRDTAEETQTCLLALKILWNTSALPHANKWPNSTHQLIINTNEMLQTLYLIEM